jgi:ribosomal protein L37AE/L43A
MTLSIHWPYIEFKDRKSRPYCDLCGPFASRFMRKLVTGDWRCRGCDDENES